MSPKKMPDDSEQQLQRDATSNVREYDQIKILERLLDQDSIVVAETLLVARMTSPLSRYALRIVELRSESALRAITHEIDILRKLGTHKAIMGLYLPFRHRQYVGMLQPPYSTLQDRVDLLHRFKKNNGETRIFFRNPWLNRAAAEPFSQQRAADCLRRPGVFTRDAVVDGEQIYDQHIAAFLNQCHQTRPPPQQLLSLPFLARPFNSDEGGLGIGVEPRDDIVWNTQRSLLIDMLTVHTLYASLKEDLLHQICNAIHRVRDKRCCPIFEGNLEKGIRDDQFLAVDVSLAFAQEEDDLNWSRDVLNVSNASSPGRVEGLRTARSKTTSATGEPVRRVQSSKNTDNQRCELVFFVNRMYVSATFYTRNLERLDFLESVLMGKRRIAGWEFVPEQRREDTAEHSQQTMLTTLLQARRRNNPNAEVSSEIDGEISNQARRAKLWGDYTRDFMFRFAKYAVPDQLIDVGWALELPLEEDVPSTQPLEASPCSSPRRNRMDE